MGKWSYLKDTLKPLPDDSPKHKEMVEERQKVLREKYQMTAQFAAHYAKLRELKEQKELERAALQIELDACETCLKENFEKESLTKLTLETGETVSTSPEPYAKVIDKEAMMQWVRDEGLESFLTVPWQTLNSHLKQRLEAGGNAMPGIEPFLRWKVSFRKNG